MARPLPHPSPPPSSLPRGFPNCPHLINGKLFAVTFWYLCSYHEAAAGWPRLRALPVPPDGLLASRCQAGQQHRPASRVDTHRPDNFPSD